MTKHGVEDIRVELRKGSFTPWSKTLRARYWATRETQRRLATRSGCWLALAIHGAFACVDLVALPDVALQIIASRLLAILCIGLAFEAAYRLDARADALDAICALGIVLAFLSWLVPASGTQDRTMFQFYSVFSVVFMMGANLFFVFRPALASLVCTLILAIMLYAAIIEAEPLPISSIVIGSFVLTCYLFTSFINVRGDRERYKIYLNAVQASYLKQESDERGQKLLHQSRTDFLTGLDNRRSLDRHLSDWWDRWLAQSQNFATILIDVDFFKKFNDGHGHLVGDRCLIRIAGCLRDLARDHDAQVGRFGGEEFLMIAPVEDVAEVARLGEIVRARISALGIDHGYRQDGMANVTVSIGASFTRASHVEAERMIHEADRALYVAKANGRDSIHIFDPADPQTNEDSENVAALLKIARERDLVSLVYQPIVGVANLQTEAVEALMRLRTLDGSIVPPSLFIPVAERTGAIVPLGLWALDTVCRDVLASGVMPLASVNVSAVQLRAPGFAASVGAILERTGVSGSQLALEVTEGLEIDMDAGVLRALHELRRLGVQLWLDDFGTGFAGLSWLRLIDFDTVKIDKSFLHAVGQPAGQSMLRDIITLLRNRRTSILVEGVETPEQLAFAQEQNLNQAQGYLLGRPEALASLVRSG